MLVLRIALVFLCIVVVTCEELSTEDVVDVRASEEKKDAKGLSGGVKRTTTQATTNATRDSQLLSVLAARRRQLLNGRLATHINTLASLAHKSHKLNTTFAQLEVRDSNNSVFKRITFDNNSNDFAPTLKLVSNDGSKEIRQDVKPHEIRHLFVPKVYHDNRNRAGFLNNRRKDLNVTRNDTVPSAILAENAAAIFIPPEKLEGLDKEIELDPDEEFQVDESNHGLYLLNYSDTDNITVHQVINNTLSKNDTKDLPAKLDIPLTTTTTTPQETTPIEVKIRPPLNNTVKSNEVKLFESIKADNSKEKDNKTQFMSDEIYNHFRPLETELPAEDMAPFIYFGQKIGSISDNLTNSPSLSASTKSVNLVIAPHERRKFNSKYSVTEKYQNSSVGEEEINEDMDVSVIKPVVEKNKVRNSVKGPAPARHVGLVNAYRKFTTISTSKPPNIAQLNVTDPIISVTPSTIDINKNNSRTDATGSKEFLTKHINTTLNITDVSDNVNTTVSNKNIQNKLNVTSPAQKNYTRNYQNVRRRPIRVSATNNVETIASPFINATTEKSSTLVYTAVVTSVSITSSMKGHNKTDFGNSTTDSVTDNNDNDTSLNGTILNVTEEPTTTNSPSTHRPYNKHRIRIRTTTESTVAASPVSVNIQRQIDIPLASELTTRNSELKNDTVSSRSERLANLYGRPEPEINNSSTIRPKNILRRRRPTTSTTTTPSTTTTARTTTVAPTKNVPFIEKQSVRPTIVNTFVPPTPVHVTSVPPTVPTEKTFVVTSRTSSESNSKQFYNPSNPTNSTSVNYTNVKLKEGENLREEVVIEAEKTYTASYVLAGLGFLPVAAIVIFVLRGVFNKKTKDIDTDYEGYFDDSEIKKESAIIPVARPPMPPPSKPDKKWEFPRNKLRLQTLLGQGNFGQVWKAEADDLTGHDGLTRLVAVKSIKETASQKEKQELLHEIYIMQKIGTHTNVVTLLACCTEQEPYLLIMEYVMCGRLLSYLRGRRARGGAGGGGLAGGQLGAGGALAARDLTVFAYCVARGMDYIASKGIVHRDLAARNVLVDHNKLCKIADFGMSRETASEDRAKQRHALPVRWMAPEALLYNVYSHETDVWAFGILLWEIVTLGSTPYAAMTGREVLAAVTDGYRLERPPHCKPQLYRAMHSCWHSDPTQRPSFASLKSQLAELLENEPEEGNYVDLDSFYQESSVYSDPSAIIHDDEGLSAEYDRERRCFRELAKGPPKYDNRAFNFRDEEPRKFGIGTPRMGGFGIRDVPFNEDFKDRQFSDKSFNERSFGEKNFGDRNFNENFNERKDGKLSTSSFHRERERENPLVSRNSFSGFPRVGTRENHFQLLSDGRNKRVPEFECDI